MTEKWIIENGEVVDTSTGMTFDSFTELLTILNGQSRHLTELSKANEQLQKENKILYDENIQLRTKLLHFHQLKDDVEYLKEKGVF